MKKRIGSYPRVRVGGRWLHGGLAGGRLLVEAARKIGLDQAISAGLSPWRRPRAVHDPGKVLLDVALAVALGGDCLADVGVLRAEPAVANCGSVLDMSEHGMETGQFGHGAQLALPPADEVFG